MENNIDIKVELLYNNMFHKYYSRNYSLSDNWNIIFTNSIPRKKLEDGRNNHYIPIKDKIKELLQNNYKVKTGYTCTSIRGVHDYMILYK